MNKIKVTHNPSADKLQDLGVSKWPIWTKEASEFPWTYDEPETCYLLEGEVTVTCRDGETVSFGKGDLVTSRRACPAPGRSRKTCGSITGLGEIV